MEHVRPVRPRSKTATGQGGEAPGVPTELLVTELVSSFTAVHTNKAVLTKNTPPPQTNLPRCTRTKPPLSNEAKNTLGSREGGEAGLGFHGR